MYREFIVFSMAVFTLSCKYVWAKNKAVNRSPEPVKFAGIFGMSIFINLLSEIKVNFIFWSDLFNFNNLITFTCTDYGC